MDTGHRAGIYAIRDAFANLGHNRMSHGVFSLKIYGANLLYLKSRNDTLL
jgi:hypothetical protein